MNAPATADSRTAATAPLYGMSGHAMAIVAGLAALGAIFWREVVSAISTWESSTAYNHCFLVIPIAAYLIWDRKETLIGLVARPIPLVALAGLPVAVAWLVAERLGIMEGRQLMVVTLAELLFLAVLGWRLWWAVSGPLLYLYFLVPFGEFLTPKLQDITAVFIRHGVDILGIPAFIDGYTIEIPEGTFYVAEACAGLRFLIASIAFGVLYALMMYRTPLRRTVFIAVSIVVPIIANGFRALGIVYLGHILGSAEAGAADHVIYGWIFFSVVILILIVIGLPFRQDVIEERRPMPVPAPVPGPVGMAWAATLGVVVIAVLSPGVAMGLDRAGMSQIAAARPLVTGQGCVSGPPSESGSPGIRRVSTQVVCGLSMFDVTVATFPARSTAGPVVAERRRLSRPPTAEETVESPLTGPGGDRTAWRMIRSSEPTDVAAAGVWVDGEPIGLGMGMRMHMAQTSLTGSRFSPVVVVVRPVADWRNVTPEMRRRLEQNLAEFLLSQPDLATQAARMGALSN